VEGPAVAFAVAFRPLYEYSAWMQDEILYYVYIVASRSHTFYIGFTSGIEHRIWEHKNKVRNGFSKTYNCNRLVWYERYGDVHAAIAREKQLRRWSREKKITLIERTNPTWVDLSEDWGKPIDMLAGPSIALRSGRDDKSLDSPNRDKK
jgi:putative endonuclease